MLELSPGQWELRNNDYYASLLSGACSPELLGEIGAFHREFCALIFSAAGEDALAEPDHKLPHRPFFPQAKALLAARR